MARLQKLLQWLAHRQDLIPSVEIDTIIEREAGKMMPSYAVTAAGSMSIIAHLSFAVLDLAEAKT